MSRPLRIEYCNAWYHVMNRGRHHDRVFADAFDYSAFVSLLVESTNTWQVRIVAYCLMPNHYHLILQTPQPNLGRCMRHINGVYTQRFNRRHATDGPLFRGRYKAILIEAERYLLELVRYIHRNPVRAGLAKHPDRYEWSSYGSYVSMTGRNPWLFKDYVLAQFGRVRSEAIASFESFMTREDSRSIRRLYASERLPPVLGGTGFLESLRSRLQDEKLSGEIPDSRILMPSFDDIVESVGRKYGVESGRLVPGRRGCHTEPRAIIAYLARRLTGEGLKAIAGRFGLKRHGSVGKMIERLRKRAASDRALQESIINLENELRRGHAST